MSRWDFDLNVSADEIVVTVPSTNYTVTYHKPDNSPQRLARKFPSKDDRSAPMTQAEFLAEGLNGCGGFGRYLPGPARNRASASAG
jgi:hypothetical protein